MPNWFDKVHHQPDAYLLALLVFLLPFDRIPSFDVAGATIRLSTIAALAVIVRAGWVWFSASDPLRRINPAIVVLMIFMLWLVLLVPSSLNLSRASQVVAFTAFTIVTAVAVAQLFEREYLALITKALLASVLVVCLFGLYQYFGNLAGLPSNLTGLRERYSWQIFGFPRIESTFLEPLYLASFLLLPSAILMALHLIAPRRRLVLGLMGLTAVCLFLTVSRGGSVAYAALIPAIGLIALINHRRGLLWAWGRIVAVALLSFGAALAIIFYLGRPISIQLGPAATDKPLRNYAAQISTTGLEGAGDERAHAREDAWRLFLTQPLDGIGPGNFGPYVQHNQEPAAGWSIVNNEPLELLSETGLIGFGLFVSFGLMLAQQTYLALRTSTAGPERVWLIGLLGYLVALAIQYQTFSTLYIMHLWVPIGLLLGLIMTQSHGRKKHAD